MWTIVLTFMFLTNVGVKEEVMKCSTISCIKKIEHLAYVDPSVIRLQLFIPGTFAPLSSGVYIWPPLKDVWKQ